MNNKTFESDSLKNTKISRARPFFNKVDDTIGTLFYKCTLCPDNLNGTKETNLLNHLKVCHLEIYNSKIIIKHSPLYYAMKRLRLLQQCVEITTVNKQPFNDLLKSGFQGIISSKLTKLSQAGFGLNLTSPNLVPVKNHIKCTAEKIRKRIKDETKGKVLALMVDAATKNNRSVFGQSIQYINENGEVKIRAIGMTELLQSHTGLHLCNVAEKCLSEYDIPTENLISLTADNARNMGRMVKEINKSCERRANAEALDTSDDDNESELDETEDFCDDTMCDIHITQLLNENNETDDAALDSLLEQANICEKLLKELGETYQKKYGTNLIYVNGINCASHTLQLSVNDALKRLDVHHRNIISLSRQVAKHLHSQNCRYELKSKNIDISLPRLDVKTRWNSTYYMVNFVNYITFFSITFSSITFFPTNIFESFSQVCDILKSKRAVSYCAKANKHCKLLLKKWEILKEIKKILKIPYQSTIAVQKADFTLSDFYAKWITMKIKLEKKAKKTTNKTKLAHHLLDTLKLREDILFKNGTTMSAVFLDPRFKNEIEKDEDKLRYAKESLLEIWGKIQNAKTEPKLLSEEAPPPQENSSSDDTESDSEDDDDILDEYFREQGIPTASSDVCYKNASLDVTKGPAEILSQIEFYRKELSAQRLPSKTSVLKFWFDCREKVPELFEIAKAIFCIPPSQSTVERAFSVLNIVFDNRRCALRQELLEDILIIALNEDLFHQINEEDMINLKSKMEIEILVEAAEYETKT